MKFPRRKFLHLAAGAVVLSFVSRVAWAQGVVLYEESPTEPQGKRSVGSAIWRTETTSRVRGQPPVLAIRADVEIPERNLAMTWLLYRNIDSKVPASHLVEFRFTLRPDFPRDNISNVPGMLVAASAVGQGEALAGLTVKVTDGYFLLGLDDAKRERNEQLLLAERAWFAIPVVYSDNHRAILSIEKGALGERVFAEAFAAWR